MVQCVIFCNEKKNYHIFEKNIQEIVLSLEKKITPIIVPSFLLLFSEGIVPSFLR